jgi:hypothetical protein
LSETEKNTIINKGLSSGIPQDEISMILDSKVAEKQKILSQNAAPKSDKYGDIKKCPACGAIVTSFSSICGDCGHEFSNIGANISIEKLFQMLTEIDNRPREKFGIFEKGKQMDYESDLLNKKTEIIKNFPIPNTKNDIFEFLTYAVPYARLVKTGAESIFASKQWAGVSDSYKKNEIGKAWKYKCEQIIMKAKFSLKEDTKGLEEIKKYAQELGIK